jgi:GT2 family glycosyltransferase
LHRNEGLTGAAGHPAPLVYTVLLNWKGCDDTIACLESVFRADDPRSRVIVCDNDSQDGSLERIREWAEGRPDPISPDCPTALAPSPEAARLDAGRGHAERDARLVLLQTGANLGFTGGCNVGIAYALARGADYVFLLNNDATVEPVTLARLVAAAEASGAGIAGARVLDGAGRSVLFSGARWPWLLFGIGAARARAEVGDYWDSDYASGCAILLRRDLLLERFRGSGYYFDPSLFMYCEEVDLCLFGRARGYGCIIVRDAVIYHTQAKSSGGFLNPRSYYYITRNRIRLANRWLGGVWWALFHTYYVPSRLLLQSLGRANWRPRVFESVVQGLVDGYLGVSGKWKFH